MNKILYSAFLLFSLLLNAQNPGFNTENVSPTKGDLEATLYPEDSIANAVFLYEEGFSEFDEDEDYDIVKKYHAKIKIFNKEGFDHANIEIFISKNDHSSEKLINLKASTYNLENGKIVKVDLDRSQVYTEELENYDLKKFTFPAVKPGSVLVYSYELISPYKFNFTTWNFQTDIPKAYSKFTAKIPANYEYYTTKIGPLELKTNSSKVIKDCMRFGVGSSTAGCIETVYAMEDIPAFRTETYLSSRRNFISRIEFELKQIIQLDGFKQKYTKEWEDVDKELETNKGIGRQLKKDRLVDDLLPAGISNLPNNLEKAKKIYKYVQEEFTWNQEYKIFHDMNIRDIRDEKTGNILELNVLLHNIYESEGFSVLPVMAATRGKGLPKTIHPVLSDFNYFFIQLNVDDEKYLLDASEKNLAFGQLPYRALNHYARLMDFENGSSWIDIQPEKFSRVLYRDSIKINPDGSSQGYSIHSASGYHALDYRDRIEEIEAKDIFKELSNPIESTQVQNTEIFNNDDESKNFEIRYSLNNSSQKINDKIYFNPFSFKFFEDNPFKQEKRLYPIDFGYKDLYVYSAIIEIPKGYKVSSIPEPRNLKIQGNAANLRFTASQTGENTINVQCRLTFPYAEYPAEYYPALKQFFDNILEVQSQSLIVIEENS